MLLSQRVTAVVLMTICCFACSTSPTPMASGSVKDLYSRALSLPGLTPGSVCPVSPQQTFNDINPAKEIRPGSGLGTWPVFLGGQDKWFDDVAANIWVNPEYSGPLLVRGKQIDGPGGMPLMPAGPHGVEFVATTDTTHWRDWSGRIAEVGPGCYGLQADGLNFTSQIFFAIETGSPPPG